MENICAISLYHCARLMLVVHSVIARWRKNYARDYAVRDVTHRICGYSSSNVMSHIDTVCHSELEMLLMRYEVIFTS